MTEGMRLNGYSLWICFLIVGTWRLWCCYKGTLVEILRFRHFSRHVVFDAEGDKFRNKRIEDYITVSVVIDMECGNTKN